LILTGDPEIGLGRVVSDISRFIYRKHPKTTGVHLYTIFKRQSPIHPFLNSIQPGFIEKVHQFLRREEKITWQDNSNLIQYLKNQDVEGKCPDRLFQDFFMAYNLYLTAYTRMMEQMLLPTIFICEDVGGYHSQSIKALAILLKDFLKIPSFIPVVLGEKNKIPKEIDELDFRYLDVFPTSWREVRILAESIFPGIDIPRSVLREIAKSTGGAVTPILHSLYYLLEKEKIKKADNTYYWLPKKENHLRLPKNHLICTFSLLKGFDPITRDILYTTYLSGGLLNKSDLLKFLVFHGTSESDSNEALEYLSYLGFISMGESIIPLIPSLKKKIEGILGRKSVSIQKDLLNFLIKQHTDGKYRHLVLLFYFLARNKKLSLANNILPAILRQKLNERDFTGVKPFLRVDETVFKDRLRTEDSNRLNLVLKAARLRYNLNREGGTPAADGLQSIRDKLKPSRERGHYLLQVASYFLQKGEISQAVEACKVSLIDFNEYGSKDDEAMAYNELGLTMLAGGRLEDAIEYFMLSNRTLEKSSFERLRCLANTVIVLFIYGNLTGALKLLDEAISLSSEMSRREWQLFLLFFKGRILFHMGDYQDANAIFQECLTLSRLYSFPESVDVIDNWLSRSHVYSGEIKEGLAHLKKRKNQESLFFLSEACYFQRKYRESLVCLEKASEYSKNIKAYPAERIFWNNGYASIEGRCLTLEADETQLERLIRSFRAYVMSRCGARDRAVVEFRELTRLTKLNELDIYNNVYFYFYSLTLPDLGEDESVDKLTILNQALKSLQERAGRIESPDHRAVFLGKNRWNKRIMNEARKRRLL
jgi:tetratricopeptide (TPR) repeat protein